MHSLMASFAELFHPEHVGPLTLDIDGPHVDRALEAKAGSHGGRGHAVLPGAGLGDDAGFAHAPDQQPLPHDIVDLVGAGVIEVFALEKDAGAADGTAEVVERGNRRGPAGVAAHHLDELLPQSGIAASLVEGPAEFFEGAVQNLRHKGAAVRAVVSRLRRRQDLGGQRARRGALWSQRLSHGVSRRAERA